MERQKGKWNGKQVLPAAWVEEASTIKIYQDPEAAQSKKDSSDWLQGCCYQMWRCRHNCFRADGAYGQYIIVMPDQDAVIAITCETTDMQDELNLIWEYLLPAIKTDKMAENNALSSTLKQKLLSLALPLPGAGNSTNAASRISGKTFTLGPNERHMETVTFQFINNNCNVSLMINSVPYNLSFGPGQWITGETTLRGPNLLLLAKAHFVGLPPARIAGSYSWKDENTLELVLRYIESPHTETISCKLDNNKISVNFLYSNEPNNVHPEIKGVAKN